MLSKTGTTSYTSAYLGQSDAISAVESKGMAFQVSIEDSTPDASVIACGVAAALTGDQHLTYTAANLGAGGNDISIAYTDGATAGAEVVTVTGTDISIQIQDGVTTSAQVITAVEASAEATALVEVALSDAGGTVDVAAAQDLTGGTETYIDLTEDLFYVEDHGLTTGLKVAATTSDTLPTGTSATDYYIYVEDDNQFGLATSQANALAGTLVSITGQGVGNTTLTPAGVTAANTLTLLGSVDGISYYPVYKNGSALTVTMNTGSLPNILLTLDEISCNLYKFQTTVATGAIDVSIKYVGLQND